MRRLRLAFLASLCWAACGPNQAAFYEKTFTCDTNLPSSQCGTTQAGVPLMCFAAKQLGATHDFCVERCAEQMDFSDTADSVCMASTAKLKVCHPSEKTADDPDGCGPDLACYRTDLLRDQGVCLAMGVCTEDTDCPNPALNSCAGTAIKDLFPDAHFLLDNLTCVASGCKANQTACPSGESCLPVVVKAATRVPDVCVPDCDANLNCPPNYYCWRRVSGPDSPNVCVPGLQGSRCANSIDCIVGDCVDTHEGFNICSIPCEQQEDCLPFSGTAERMYCVSGAADGQGSLHCVSPGPFEGAACLSSGSCPSGQQCFKSSPYSPMPNLVGDCRLPCGPADECPVRGGIAHTCFIRGSERSCYPGRVGLPCRRSEQCVPGMSCQDVAPEERLAGAMSGAAAASRICTFACQSDTDCDAYLGPSQEGYCEGGWCRLGGGPGEACSRDAQCRGEGRCVVGDGGASGTCVY